MDMNHIIAPQHTDKAPEEHRVMIVLNIQTQDPDTSGLQFFLKEIIHTAIHQDTHLCALRRHHWQHVRDESLGTTDFKQTNNV